jgi:PPOX class probable FMN-dependent enzyme
MPDAQRITSLAELEALYGVPAPDAPALLKEAKRLVPPYRAYVEASPFCLVATCGPGGLDVSPKGDAPGFVKVLDETTLLLPDRPGNNRLDGYRNLLADPRVALIFLVPGCGETLRVNGRAAISTDPAHLALGEAQGRLPKSALVVTVESCFVHCSKALMRSKLWDPATRVDRASLPTLGAILAHLTESRIDGSAYDRALPARLEATLY